jgi:hypothetical protein
MRDGWIDPGSFVRVGTLNLDVFFREKSSIPHAPCVGGW